MPLRPQPSCSSNDHGNCRYGWAPRPAISSAPVGRATPTVIDRSIFPGTGLICHFTAGPTSEKPELPGTLTFAKKVGRSTKTSRQGAIPSRHRLLVPSPVRPPSRELKLRPFSLWKLPTGTTRLEFVTSGRSVAISSDGCGQLSARASATDSWCAKPSATRKSKRSAKRAFYRCNLLGASSLARLTRCPLCPDCDQVLHRSELSRWAQAV